MMEPHMLLIRAHECARCFACMWDGGGNGTTGGSNKYTHTHTHITQSEHKAHFLSLCVTARNATDTILGNKTRALL